MATTQHITITGVQGDTNMRKTKSSKSRINKFQKMMIRRVCLELQALKRDIDRRTSELEIVKNSFNELQDELASIIQHL